MDRHPQSQPSSQPEQPKPAANAEAGSGVEQNLLSDETAQLIRRKAKRLIARSGLPSSELDEIVQALHVLLVQASKLFDSERGTWLAFTERVLQFALNKLLRSRFAKRRDPRKCISLNVLVEVSNEHDVRELAQLITSSDLVARTGGHAIDEFERANLRLDLVEFLKSLPEPLRELAESLASESILDISRRTEVPRSTMYYQVDRIRKLAEDAGLAKYLT